MRMSHDITCDEVMTYLLSPFPWRSSSPWCSIWTLRERKCTYNLCCVCVQECMCVCMCVCMCRCRCVCRCVCGCAYTPELPVIQDLLVGPSLPSVPGGRQNTLPQLQTCPSHQPALLVHQEPLHRPPLLPPPVGAHCCS